MFFLSGYALLAPRLSLFRALVNARDLPQVADFFPCTLFHWREHNTPLVVFFGVRAPRRGTCLLPAEPHVPVRPLLTGVGVL